MTNFVIGAVDAEDVSVFLPLMEHYLVPALNVSGTYHLADIVREIAEGDSWLFIADDGEQAIGAAVVGIEVYPRKKYVVLHLLGGERAAEWAPLLVEKLKILAKEMSFDGVRVEGRKGWTKLFPEAKQESVVLTIEVGETDGE